jgi:diadenosine tetraphosphate (Ap4A) HIT family hydrolase
VARFQDLTAPEKARLLVWIDWTQQHLQTHLTPPPDAFNLGLNDGPAAGQTMPQLHFHVIVQLLRLLLSVPNAVETDTFLEFCRSQRLQDSVRITDESFADELARLRQSQSRPADAR